MPSLQERNIIRIINIFECHPPNPLQSSRITPNPPPPRGTLAPPLLRRPLPIRPLLASHGSLALSHEIANPQCSNCSIQKIRKTRMRRQTRLPPPISLLSTPPQSPLVLPVLSLRCPLHSRAHLPLKTQSHLRRNHRKTQIPLVPHRRTLMKLERRPGSRATSCLAARGLLPPSASSKI